MKRLARTLTLAMTLAVTESYAVSSRELVARAVAAQASGDLATAARSLEELVAAGLDSTDVLYDLGTVYTRAERYGEAVWCFERVLLRAPGHLAARRNLRATRVRLARRDAARTGRAVVETQPSLAVQIGELMPLRYSVPLVMFAEIAVIALWFARRRSATELRRVGATAGVALSLLAGATGVGLVAARRARPPSAIVLHGGLRLLQSPRVDGIPDAAVREGERVELTRREGGFARVRAVGGSVGWLPSRELGALTE